MRGKHLHNTVLLAPLLATLRKAGLRVVEEAPLPYGAGAVDVLVEDGQGRRVVVECETGAKRVRWAVLKAAQLAETLIVLVPDGRTAKKCRAALRRPPRLDHLSQLTISVLTYGALWQHLPRYLPTLPGPRGERREIGGRVAAGRVKRQSRRVQWAAGAGERGPR